MRLLIAACAAVILAASTAHAGACRDLAGMVENFQQVYPTGGPVERVSGQRGRLVMDRLAVQLPGMHVAFLYSGDGPVTGARGRYLYLVLDADECVLAHDWIDGPTFDRALIVE